MRKFNLGRFFDDRRLMILFSVFLAVVSWFVVGYSIDTSTAVPRQEIPVDIGASQTEALSANGLKIVEGKIPTVNAVISGERIVLGGVKPTDISIIADLSGITTSGTYNNIKLIGIDRFGKGFTVDQITPPVITLKIDRFVSKKFTVSTDVEGLQIPDGYIGMDTIVSPREVTITGPEADINRIDKCEVTAVFQEPLTRNTTVKSNIQLFDSEGNQLDSNLYTMEQEQADIMVTVLKQKWLPVTVDFLNVPTGFPLEELEFTLSHEKLLAAGPETVIDGYEDLNIGYVDLTEVNLDWMQVFDIQLRSDFINVENVKSISVEFNTEEMIKEYFTISNITAINVPGNYEVTINTPQITGVQMIASQEVMESLSAQDIVAEIDISEREVSPGPYSLPVHISAPSKGLVWASGTYTAVVTIKEK